MVAIRLPENEYAFVERDGIAVHLFADNEHRSAVDVHIFTAHIEQLLASLQRKLPPPFA